MTAVICSLLATLTFNSIKLHSESGTGNCHSILWSFIIIIYFANSILFALVATCYPVHDVDRYCILLPSCIQILHPGQTCSSISKNPRSIRWQSPGLSTLSQLIGAGQLLPNGTPVEKNKAAGIEVFSPWP